MWYQVIIEGMSEKSSEKKNIRRRKKGNQKAVLTLFFMLSPMHKKEREWGHSSSRNSIFSPILTVRVESDYSFFFFVVYSRLLSSSCFNVKIRFDQVLCFFLSSFYEISSIRWSSKWSSGSLHPFWYQKISVRTENSDHFVPSDLMMILLQTHITGIITMWKGVSLQHVPHVDAQNHTRIFGGRNIHRLLLLLFAPVHFSAARKERKKWKKRRWKKSWGRMSETRIVKEEEEGEREGKTCEELAEGQRATRHSCHSSHLCVNFFNTHKIFFMIFSYFLEVWTLL